jgi:pSer/pThr/pTyr-binding forkhead associated (FHA) protein
VRFRLRYQQHDLELGEGEFAIGRNASCQLSLDDPLVSRRHALLVVTHEGVTIEDLESRNGVLVNGQKIPGRTILGSGDRITIGSQEMVVVVARDGSSMTPHTRNPLKMTQPRLQAPPDTASPNQPLSQGTPLPSPEELEPSMVRRADAFNLLGGVAEKALAMGKAAEAERILASPLADVIEASRAGKRVTPSLADQAARFSAKLATSTGKGAWADYVIELYSAQGRMAPAPVIDELYNALRKVSAIDLALLRGYVEQLRQRLPQYGPAERFLFQRLEGLERLAALR